MKYNYWSCSKFADWLRGTPKILAGTAEDWNSWTKTAKAKKTRCWLAEDGLDFLQNFVYWPLNFMNNVRHYFDNRWISKTHALTSNLKRGQWHEFDIRLLHTLFDELVNFVEIDQAWHSVACAEEEDKKYKAPLYRTVFHLRLRRQPQAGLAYLEWASGLKKNEDWVEREDPSFGQPTPQAVAAQETIKLYKWWKEQRPKRSDPMDVSGWSNYSEERRLAAEAQGDDHSWSGFDMDGGEQERLSKILQIYRKIEHEQVDEDTEMLIRLIKIRSSLWT